MSSKALGFNCTSINQRYLSFVLLIVAATTLTVLGDCGECTTENRASISEVCHDEKQKLEKSETTKNKTSVCSALHEHVVCVGRNFPQCFALPHEYESYTKISWGCVPTTDQVYLYQVLDASGGCSNDVNINIRNPSSNNNNSSNSSAQASADANTDTDTAISIGISASLLRGVALIWTLKLLAHGRGTLWS